MKRKLVTNGVIQAGDVHSIEKLTKFAERYSNGSCSLVDLKTGFAGLEKELSDGVSFDRLKEFYGFIPKTHLSGVKKTNSDGKESTNL